MHVDYEQENKRCTDNSSLLLLILPQRIFRKTLSLTRILVSLTGNMENKENLFLSMIKDNEIM